MSKFKEMHRNIVQTCQKWPCGLQTNQKKDFEGIDLSL